MTKRAKITTGAGLLTLTLLIGACDVNIIGVRGSGDVVTEEREVSGFDEIDLRGSGTVSIAVTGTESLTIEAEDNIIPLLTTDVRGGRLVLESSQSISPTREIVYTITAAALDGVSISGSGSVTATDVDTGEFVVEISGSGEVFPSGVSESLDLSISGSGEFGGEDLVSKSGTVIVSGSGDAVVNVTDDLDVQVSGSGNVEYIGDPRVSVSTSGSGDVSGR